MIRLRFTAYHTFLTLFNILSFFSAFLKKSILQSQSYRTQISKCKAVVINKSKRQIEIMIDIYLFLKNNTD